MSKTAHFEWDESKDKENQKKHGVPFALAQYAFADHKRVILKDLTHSDDIGKADDGILTVRFTYRNNKIRIFGAGYWRKGKKIYEKENQIH